MTSIVKIGLFKMNSSQLVQWTGLQALLQNRLQNTLNHTHTHPPTPAHFNFSPVMYVSQRAKEGAKRMQGKLSNR